MSFKGKESFWRLGQITHKMGKISMAPHYSVATPSARRIVFKKHIKETVNPRTLYKQNRNIGKWTKD